MSKVFGIRHGMLQGYCSMRHSLSSCVIAEENGDIERDYAYTIGRAMSDVQTPTRVGPAVRAVLYRACHRVNSPP
ncbi:hypothetical protein ACLK19_28605 [Escherichia coli]